MPLRTLIYGAITVAAIVACGSVEAPSGPVALYHRDGGPLLPFPSDRFTRAADTATGLRPHVQPFVSATDPVFGVYTDMVAELERLDGFGTSAAITIGFSEGIDIGTLPGSENDVVSQIAASTQPSAAVGLIDAASGERVAFTWRYAADGNLLALYPTPALKPKHSYIYYVSDCLTGLDGRPVRADARLMALLDENASVSAAQTISATTFPESYVQMLRQDAARISASSDSRVVLIDRFTTQSIYDETLALRDRINASYLETIDSVTDTGRGAEFAHVGAILEAVWTEHDYRDSNRRLDATAATPHRTDRWPFYIALPAAGAQPYPVVLVQHGLGDSREVLLKLVDQLASFGLATVAIDAPEHGARVPPSDDELGEFLTRLRDSLGFWLTRDRFDIDLHKIRDLFRQAVIDHAQIRQALRNTAAALDFDANGIADLDVNQWFYYGQSMGAIIGTMTVAQSPDIPAAVLNVGGARLTGYAFHLPWLELARPVLETQTGSWAGALRWLSLMQTLMERGDPINYARLLQREPLSNHPARDILMQFALDDNTVPNELNWELALEAQLPLLLPSPLVPTRQSSTLPLAGGVRGNINGRSGGYVIFDRVTTREGTLETATHGNTFSSMEATTQAGCLFYTLWQTGLGTLVAADEGC